MSSLSELLTIVIPTRNRADFLELCLKSIFERQTKIPKVVVSDNSAFDVPAIDVLRAKYNFAYVRQSGKLSMTDHHNACLELVSTPWALLLHDDDELCPDILSRLESFLSECKGAGMVVGGIEYIDQKGNVRGVWAPQRTRVLRGEAAVLVLGLDFRTSPPGWIWNVEAFRQAGGFPDSDGVAADYPLVLKIAYSPGVSLFSQVIGRYRIGEQQTTNYSNPKEAEATLACSIKMAQLTRKIGISAAISDQLMDYMTWWIFRIVAGNLLNIHPVFVYRMCRKCELVTLPKGLWKSRVQTEYPVLFWRPPWLAVLVLKARLWVPSPVRRRVLACVRSFL
jgi:glycosyltransferase involved in cell wall biosynthesis